MTAGPATVAARSRVREGAALVAALRPHQWTKNLLLLAGIVFAGEVEDPARWPYALAGLVLYCALSSSAYLVNDVRDAVGDRLHPKKRLRPIASGVLAPRRALLVAGALAAGGLGLAGALGLSSLAFAAGFVALQTTYTLWLKRVYLVDTLAIAGLFVIRAAAGAAAVGVHISPWLLLCTALLALFLAFAKRRAEVIVMGAERTNGRAVLVHYELGRNDALVWTAAAATAVAYSIYTFAAHDPAEMAPTIPFVLFGLLRYLHLIRRHDLGEEPDRVLLTDIPLLAAVALWAITAAVVLNAS